MRHAKLVLTLILLAFLSAAGPARAAIAPAVTPTPGGTIRTGTLSGGGYQTCAVERDGTPVCWGLHDYGQTTVPAGTGTVTQISAGYQYSCAIETNGTPVCWGLNTSGQTTIPSGIGTVTKIAAGEYHTCAVKTDGTPVCWGANSDGQTTIPSGTGTVTQITVGQYHTCAIKSDGTPVCWGLNTSGQTTIPSGIGTVTQIVAGDVHTCAVETGGTPVCWGGSSQTTIPAGTGTVVQISAGEDHTCAIETGGTPVCWGTVEDGDLTVPAGTGTVTQITAGFRHTCAVKSDSTLLCWGDNTDGQATVPAGVAPLRRVSQVAGGEFHSCAISSDGTPVCWGSNDDGRSTVPAGVGSVTQIALGRSHSCAIKTDGTVACWGLNTDGQTTVPAALGTVTQIATGAYHTCAVKTSATVVCWGSNDRGQTTVPTGLGTVAQIMASGLHTCAITSNGTPVCWGFDTRGQTDVPSNIGTVTQLAGGYYHTCAIKTDGTPVCWGRSTEGEITVPDGTGTVTQLTGGLLHTCAVTTAGSPVCWGANEVGQTTVPSGTGTVTEVAAGYNRTCAIRTGGTVICWGDTSDGALGAAPAFTNPPVDAYVGSSAQVSVPFTASPAAQLSVSSGILPPGLSLDPATGQISGTPTGSGSYTATLSASDGVFADASQAITLRVDLSPPVTTSNVPAGYQNAPVTVTLNAGDGGAGVAKTYYTVGAAPADPTSSSAVYDPAGKPVLQDGELIKYFSVDKVGNAEAVKSSAAARVDQVAPSTTDDVPTAYVNAPVTVTLSASDAASGVAETYYTVGAAPADPTSSSAVYDPASKPVLQDGQLIKYFSVDNVGNAEAVESSAVAKLDTTAPSTTDDVPAGSHSAPFAVSLTATDTGSGVSTTYYTVGAAPADPTAQSAVYDPAHEPVLQDGQLIKYFSVDAVGNAEAVEHSATLHTPPPVTTTTTTSTTTTPPPPSSTTMTTTMTTTPSSTSSTTTPPPSGTTVPSSSTSSTATGPGASGTGELPSAPPVVAVDKTAPRLSGLTLAGRVRKGKGEKLSFSSSEAATVRLVLSRRVAGVRKGKLCEAGRAHGKQRSCQRTVQVKALTQSVAAGGDSLALATKSLPLGALTVSLTATDASGNTSAPLTHRLTITRR